MYRSIYDQTDDDSAWEAATRDPLVKPCVHCKSPVDVEPEPGQPVLCEACERENARQFEGRR